MLLNWTSSTPPLLALRKIAARGRRTHKVRPRTTVNPQKVQILTPNRKQYKQLNVEIKLSKKQHQSNTTPLDRTIQRKTAEFTRRSHSRWHFWDRGRWNLFTPQECQVSYHLKGPQDWDPKEDNSGGVITWDYCNHRMLADSRDVPKQIHNVEENLPLRRRRHNHEPERDVRALKRKR